MTPRLTIAITFAAFDTRRQKYLDALTEKLGPDAPVQIISDFKRIGQWPVARKAWLAGLDAGGTHHLVLEEDIAVCEDFVAAAESAISEVPDQMLSFFYTRKKGLELADSVGSSWLRTTSNVFGQAICMPVAMAREFIDWEEGHIRSEDGGKLDVILPFADTRIAVFRHMTNRSVWLTVPSLVDHVGGHVSTVKHTVPGHASRFIGEHISGRTIDWSRGAKSAPMESDKGFTAAHARMYYVR